MSRKSQAFAQGQPVFSWRIEEIRERDAAGEGRYKVTCKNVPEVFAFGDTEQQAFRAAQAALTARVEAGDTTMKGPGQL